uniref:LRRCT domain-containing protein n=1 Tax=Glossina brevipalpis TaxID=37001 RepID=A0A1A9WM84_9MUSC
MAVIITTTNLVQVDALATAVTLATSVVVAAASTTILPQAAFARLLTLDELNELHILDVSHNELCDISESWGISRLRRLRHLNLQYNNISELSGEPLARLLDISELSGEALAGLLDISELSGEALVGLSSLRTVDLSNNHFETLPEGLFAGSNKLREIHLKNNKLYELTKALFHRLEQLLVVDLLANQLTSNHIDNITFANNSLLTVIENTTLTPLVSLEVLMRLDGNRLVTLTVWQLQLPQFKQLRTISLGLNQWSCRCKFFQEMTSIILMFFFGLILTDKFAMKQKK